MDTLSTPTLGLLYEIAVELFDRQTELPALMMRCDLLHTSYEREIRQVLLDNLLRARAAAENQDDLQAHRHLLRFVRLIAEKRANHPQLPAAELREALLADGYQLTWEQDSLLLPGDQMVRCTIRPTDAAPVPLADEVSALESELTARGYTHRARPLPAGRR